MMLLHEAGGGLLFGLVSFSTSLAVAGALAIAVTLFARLLTGGLPAAFLRGASMINQCCFNRPRVWSRECLSFSAAPSIA